MRPVDERRSVEPGSIATGRTLRSAVADLAGIYGRDEPSDEALMHGIATRNSAALRALYERYSPTALSLAARVLRDPQLAEDVVQEAFLSMWESPAAYQTTRGSVRAYLFAIVRHRAVDRVRRESAHQRRVQEQVTRGTDVEPGIDEMVTDAAEIQLRRKQVRTALANIPTEQRRVIELMYFDGMTQQQVSDHLQLPLGTVKSRTLLGMRKLRTALAAIAIEPPL